MNRPLIGITPEAVTLPRADGRGGFAGTSCTQAIERAGGVPVALPLTRNRHTLDRFLSLCHGFVLSGGGDPSEASGAYGRKLTVAEQRTLSSVDTVRDEMELYLTRRIVTADLPVLGICRGIQILNVALGGTLLTDIPNHRGVTHRIKWTQHLGGCQQVNSTHHQALGRVAPALQVVAQAGDGVVEAVTLPGARFCVGVQFHPERLARGGRLFRTLVAAARAAAR